jgi:hypothetical protein
MARAKRLGWDQPNGLATDDDLLDPPAWMDDGLDPWVEGELSVQDFPADEMFRARRSYTINGQLIDPATLEDAPAGFHPYEQALLASGEAVTPTPAQRTAGNYKKGHMTFHGLPITIENDEGQVRRGNDEPG